MFDSFSCCRLCLQTNAGEKIDCLAIKGLKNAIQNIFGFEICEGDKHSTKICKECSFKVTNFSLYKDTVLRNQKCLEEFKLLQSQITENPLKPKTEVSDELEDVVIIESDVDSGIEKESNSDHPAKIQRLENNTCSSKISSHGVQEACTSSEKTVSGTPITVKLEETDDVTIIDKNNPSKCEKDNDECKTPLLGPPLKVQKVTTLSVVRKKSPNELESCISSNNNQRHTPSPKIDTSISKLRNIRSISIAKDDVKERVSSTQLIAEQDKPCAVVSGIHVTEIERQNIPTISPQASRSPTVTSTRYNSQDLNVCETVYIDDGLEIVDSTDPVDVPKMPILSGVFSLARDSPIARLIELTNNTNRMQGRQQSPIAGHASDQEFISVDQFFTRQNTAGSSPATRHQYNEDNRRNRYRVTLTRISDRLHIKLADALNNEVMFSKLTVSGRQAVNRTLSTSPHCEQLKRAMKTNVLDQYSVQLLHFVGLSSILNV